MSVEAQQYLRKISVVIADDTGKGFEFSDFRVRFTVRRGDFQSPNSADVRIYNLSKATATKVGKPEFTTLSISAGYPNNIALIFRGTIKQFRTGRINQMDSYVDVTAADGDEAYNFASISQPLAAGAGSNPSSVANALLTVFKAHGITQGYQPTFPNNGCVRGRVLYGMARDELRDFAWANQCSWSIQDGKLTFIPLTSYVPGNVPLITPNTGLLSVPEQSQQGLHVGILLNPNIKVGQCFKLDSTDINKLRFNLDTSGQNLSNNFILNKLVLNTPGSTADGLYYAMNVTHSGDTRGHGNDWRTDIVALAADATITSAEAESALIAVGAQSIPRY